ncbi:MAG: histidine phosphatase family protein [Chloroflexi bacterium]|nr:histidine phosphatase family protein [Chloroflexota bacterium]
MGRIFLVRHAESESNVQRFFSCRPPGAPLTERGRIQARSLGRRFADMRLARVYSSPLRRARETAATIAATTGAPLVLTDALREFDVGVLDCRGDDTAFKEHDVIVARWWAGNWDARFPGGESGFEICERLSGLLSELRLAHPGEDVAAVGHGGLFCTAIPRLCAVPVPADGSPLWIGNTAVTVLRHVGGSPAAPTCETWGCLAHLEPDSETAG